MTLEGSGITKSHMGTWLCTPGRSQSSPCPRGDLQQCHRAEPCVFKLICPRDRLALHCCPSLTTTPGQPGHGDSSTAGMLVRDTVGLGKRGRSRLEEGTLTQQLFQQFPPGSS